MKRYFYLVFGVLLCIILHSCTPEEDVKKKEIIKDCCGDDTKAPPILSYLG